MPNIPFTLRQIEVFRRLAATGSFRRTAEELGISQASVSNQVKVLEDQLGVRLFDRKPGLKPLLTPEGHAFLEDVQQFDLALARLARHRRKGAPGNERVRFRLLVGQGLFDGYVRPKLDRFYARHPLIELDFSAMPPSSALLGAIEAGRFDLGFINLRADQPYGDKFRRLALVRGGIFGHRSFAAGKRLPLSPEEINLLPFVLPQAGSRQERELLQALDRYGIRPRKVVGHSPYYDVMAAMLDRGIAVASFSDTILPVASRRDVIQLMPIDDWNLLMFRRPGLADPRLDTVEDFLVGSILSDPSYPALARFDERGARV